MLLKKIFILNFVINLSLCNGIPRQEDFSLFLNYYNENSKGSKGNPIILPLYGCTQKLNYFYTKLNLNNKINHTYIIDTRSDIITSPCNLCQNCSLHYNEFYNLDTNPKFIKCNNEVCQSIDHENQEFCDENIKCIFNKNYIEDNSNLRGYLIDTNVYINNKKFDKKIILGCTISEKGKFINEKADGIMGLNRKENSFISSLFNKNIINKNLFSICLGTVKGGFMSIGEIYPNIKSNKGKIYYTPLINKEHEYDYVIKFNYIIISKEKKIINNNYECILDSSSTLTIFPENLYKEIVGSFKRICEKNLCNKIKIFKNNRVCFNFDSKKEMGDFIEYTFPDLYVNFDKFNFVWEPKNYLIDFSMDGYFSNCLGFIGEKRNNIILGSTFMRGNNIIFDNMKNQIGFIKSQCVYSKFSVKTYDFNYIFKILLKLIAVILIGLIFFKSFKKIKNCISKQNDLNYIYSKVGFSSNSSTQIESY